MTIEPEARFTYNSKTEETKETARQKLTVKLSKQMGEWRVSAAIPICRSFQATLRQVKQKSYRQLQKPSYRRGRVVQDEEPRPTLAHLHDVGRQHAYDRAIPPMATATEDIAIVKEYITSWPKTRNYGHWLIWCSACFHGTNKALKASRIVQLRG